ENRNHLIFNDTTHIRKKTTENQPKEESTYSESPIALIGEIKDKDAFIYENPQNANESWSAKGYRKESFYIRKQAFYQDEIYYLLSREMSAVDGVIGWIKSDFLKVHKHMIVDYDQKQFTLTGQGNGYNMPRGRNENRRVHGLSAYENKLFQVVETNIVGKNLWYKGQIEGEGDYIWVFHNKITNHRAEKLHKENKNISRGELDEE